MRKKRAKHLSLESFILFLRGFLERDQVASHNESNPIIIGAGRGDTSPKAVIGPEHHSASATCL